MPSSEVEPASKTKLEACLKRLQETSQGRDPDFSVPDRILQYVRNTTVDLVNDDDDAPAQEGLQGA